MTGYEKLLDTAQKDNVTVIEGYAFDSEKFKGLYSDGVIALDKRITTETEKKCILAEELGHHYTSHGNIIDMEDASNRKQEYRARVWAYRDAFDLVDLVSAYKYGCKSRYEIAEYLDITENFLADALDHYKAQYGLFTKVDKYLVYFDPLGVLEVNM